MIVTNLQTLFSMFHGLVGTGLSCPNKYSGKIFKVLRLEEYLQIQSYTVDHVYV